MVRGLEMTDDKRQIKSLLEALDEVGHRNLSFAIWDLSLFNPPSPNLLRDSVRYSG
jgi:hypothetical protein